MLELFCCLALWKMRIFIFHRARQQKALALFGCPVFSGHDFSLSGWTFLNEARSQYPTKFNKWKYFCTFNHWTLTLIVCLQKIWNYGPPNWIKLSQGNFTEQTWDFTTLTFQPKLISCNFFEDGKKLHYEIYLPLTFPRNIW